MIEIKTKLRRWGNSFGIVVPQKAVETSRIKEGEEIVVMLKKEENIMGELFGSLKGWRINTQRIKDDLRKEEREAEKRKWTR